MMSVWFHSSCACLCKVHAIFDRQAELGTAPGTPRGPRANSEEPLHFSINSSVKRELLLSLIPLF